MNWYIGVGLSILYFMIGMFFGGLIVGDSEDGLVWVMIFWPIIVAGALLFIALLAPFRLAQWIRNVIEKE